MVRRPYLPGKPRHAVRGEPYGIIIVGQHAMRGGGGFAPHTIQSPPIGEVTLSGIEVGEIGLELALFMDAKLLAIVGEQAAVEEAKGLCPNTVGIPVKSLEKNWFPSASDTRSAIRDKISDALQRRDEADSLHLDPPFRFTLKTTEGYRFDPEKRFFLRWLSKLIFFGVSKGWLGESEASWETKTIIGGLYALHCTRGFMKKRT